MEVFFFYLQELQASQLQRYDDTPIISTIKTAVMSILHIWMSRNHESHRVCGIVPVLPKEIKKKYIIFDTFRLLKHS